MYVVQLLSFFPPKLMIAVPVISRQPACESMCVCVCVYNAERALIRVPRRFNICMLHSAFPHFSLSFVMPAMLPSLSFFHCVVLTAWALFLPFRQNRCRISEGFPWCREYDICTVDVCVLYNRVCDVMCLWCKRQTFYWY